jgi:ArsR family transcriptional regulator
MREEADLFKSLSDPHRVRLAILLALRGELCVCEMAAALDAPEYKVSRHLSVMRSAGLVEARREGTWMYYKLTEPRHRLDECLRECFRDCLADHETVKADLERLGRASCGK